MWEWYGSGIEPYNGDEGGKTRGLLYKYSLTMQCAWHQTRSATDGHRTILSYNTNSLYCDCDILKVNSVFDNESMMTY